MVFKNIQRIKAAVPEIKHIAMFYNNGIIFQTTFEQDMNVPKLGENLAELVEYVRKIYEVSDLEYKHYKKLLIETEGISIIIFKLGEDSNIALFFEAEKTQELKINSIRRYLKRIENLTDMDEKEIILKEILEKENELEFLQMEYAQKAEKMRDIMEKSEEDVSEEFSHLSEECKDLKEDISEIEKKIDSLKKNI